MLRECVEWGEKGRRSRPKSDTGVKGLGEGNPFHDLRRAYCTEDEEFIANGMRLIESSGVEGLKSFHDEFLCSLSEAAEKTIALHRLGRADRESIGYACKRAVAELNELLTQVLELADGEDVAENDVSKAALFFYMSIGTAADMVCSLVDEIVGGVKNW